MPDEGHDRTPDELLQLVYRELRSLARARMAREPAGHTLDPTGLVHEAYLRLLRSRPSFHDRAHFFAAAARAMQRILVERARRYATARHGGAFERITLDPERMAPIVLDREAAEILDLDEALERLDRRDGEMADVVRLRFFAGLTVDETAELVGRSRRTVERQWTAARAWLMRELSR